MTKCCGVCMCNHSSTSTSVWQLFHKDMKADPFQKVRLVLDLHDQKQIVWKGLPISSLMDAGQNWQLCKVLHYTLVYCFQLIIQSTLCVSIAAIYNTHTHAQKWLTFLHDILYVGLSERTAHSSPANRPIDPGDKNNTPRHLSLDARGKAENNMMYLSAW